MAVKKVILHFGMAKTGTSSLQNALYDNTAVLEKNSFRYLTEWDRNHFKKFDRLFSDLPVFPFGMGFMGKLLYAQKNAKDIETLKKVLGTSNCESLVLSGEYSLKFHLDSTIERIKDFIQKNFYNNGIDVTIVYYVRNPLTWIISWLQQTLYTYGYRDRNWNFFENRITQYNGIFNLHTHFADSLKLLKFEDACLDKDGFAASFFRAINFPNEDIGNITARKLNESKSLESMEFMHFIEAAEPRYPFFKSRRLSANRINGDLNPIQRIKGVKYDLPYQGKLELWDRLQDTVQRLKENLGIDYSDYVIPPPQANQELYSEETIRAFIEAFPKLNLILQRYFLSFFEKKYMETAQEKYKEIHFKNSIPYELYKKKYSFVGVLTTKKNNIAGRLGKISKKLKA